MSDFTTFDELTARLIADLGAAPPQRRLLAVVGAPGAGKSTFAESLCAALNRDAPGRAMVVPMDGFHYDDSVLEPQGLLPRKGAPQTFDVEGFDHALGRLAARGAAPVALPLFDRSLEIARAGACLVPPSVEVLIVEGNYLLLQDPPWDGLHRHFWRSIRLDVPLDVLEQRLCARWLGHGFDRAAAAAKVRENDLPNAITVTERSRAADWTIRNC